MHSRFLGDEFLALKQALFTLRLVYSAVVADRFGEDRHLSLLLHASPLVLVLFEAQPDAGVEQCRDLPAIVAFRLVRRILHITRTHTHYCVNYTLQGGSVAEWLACWTPAQKGPGSNRSRDAVG